MGQGIARGLRISKDKILSSTSVGVKKNNPLKRKNVAAAAETQRRRVPPRLDSNTIREVNMKNETLISNMNSIVVDRGQNLRTSGVVPTPAPVRRSSLVLLWCMLIFVFFVFFFCF